MNMTKQSLHLRLANHFDWYSGTYQDAGAVVGVGAAQWR